MPESNTPGDFLKNLQVACLQPRMRETEEEVFSAIRKLFEGIQQQGVELVILPERWLPSSMASDLSRYVYEPNGAPVNFLMECAQKYQANIISGAIWEYDGENPKIVSYVIDSQGEIVGKQEKLHLYLLEKTYFTAGDSLYLFEYGTLKFAVLICFDMTFYETPSLAVGGGADILFSPTAIRAEGVQNWRYYLRVRALENRVPVVACNSLGEIAGSRFLGESQIIQFRVGYHSPSKLVVSELSANMEGILAERVNCRFPRRLRQERLAERIPISSLRVRHKTFRG